MNARTLPLLHHSSDLHGLTIQTHVARFRAARIRVGEALALALLLGTWLAAYPILCPPEAGHHRHPVRLAAAR